MGRPDRNPGESAGEETSQGGPAGEETDEHGGADERAGADEHVGVDEHAGDEDVDGRGGDGPTVDPGADGTSGRGSPGAGAGELALSGVSKAYGPVVAVDGVDLAVGGETLHLLVGPNGSGKTTMLRLLLGLARPTEGQVRRPGASVGAGFQHPSFYPSLAVETNVEVFGDAAGASPAWRRELLDRLGLNRVACRRAGDLSGGYAKKLDLALALLGRPAYLLLDEPLGDLDDVTRESVVAFLEEYRDDGRTVLVSTHRVRAFAGRVDHLTVVDRGEVAFDAGGDRLDRAVADAGSLRALYRAVLRG